MTKSKRLFNKTGTILAVLVFAISLFSCSSTKVESTNTPSDKIETFPKLKQGKSPYYDQFTDALKTKNDKSIEEILNNWEKDSPDGDYYKCCFTYYYYKATVPADNSKAGIPDNVAFIEDPDNKNILLYRDYTVDKKIMDKGIDYLEEGVKKYPNRIDLWNVLLTVNYQYYFYYDLKNAILDFIEVSYAVDTNLENIWYADFNNLVVTTNFNEPDSIEREMILRNASSIIDYYPVEDSLKYYEEIFTRLAELYPEDSGVLNELGYVIMFKNIKDAIPYFEKAYELDNNNNNALVNIVICLYATNDVERARYYSKLIYESGDENAINALEANLKALGLL